MMAKTLVGIIAEDKSDVEVITVIAKKIARNPFSVTSIVGHGCGKIHSKAQGWAQALHTKGCTRLILVHDLDSKKYSELLQSLTVALNPCPIKKHVIVIPTRELEAWLLADHEAIGAAMKLSKPLKSISSPEAVQNPKEYLRNLIKNIDKNIFYSNVIDNPKIAEKIDPLKLLRCPSFLPFDQFIKGNL